MIEDMCPTCRFKGTDLLPFCKVGGVVACDLHAPHSRGEVVSIDKYIGELCGCRVLNNEIVQWCPHHSAVRDERNSLRAEVYELLKANKG